MTATTLPISALRQTTPRTGFDISPLQRGVVAVVGGGFSIACTIAATRAIAGWAPAHPATHDLAVMLHVAAVLPAVPLGAWLMMARKGTPRHKLLGKIWVMLMVLAATAALFIHQINPGGFSPIHLFVPLTYRSAWQTIATARRGDIAGHKKALIGFYLGALMIPGIFSFLPGRMMWTLLLG